MAYRASPPRLVPEFDKVDAAAVEVFGVDFTAADFVNVERSGIRHEGGFARGEFAILPDKHHYDKIRFRFGPVAQANVGGASLAVWALGSDDVPHLLGTSVLGADGAFPDVEAENYQATYYVAVADIAGAGAEFSVQTFIQGVHQGYIS